jgi:hypothetical protein
MNIPTHPSTRSGSIPFLVIFLVSIIAVILLTTTGCASNGAGRSFDAQGAAILGKGTLRTTTKLALDNNPELLPEIAALNSGVAALFGGGLTAEAIAGQILLLVPNLPSDDAALFAANLADAVEYYRLKSGREGPALSLASPEVQALIQALTQGINEGIALHQRGLK